MTSNTFGENDFNKTRQRCIRLIFKNTFLNDLYERLYVHKETDMTNHVNSCAAKEGMKETEGQSAESYLELKMGPF